MSKHTFKTEKLTVGYDGIAVVSDVDITVCSGEILTLIGPNGAGKTTILKNIINQLSPIKGVVRLDECNIQGIPAKELAKKMAVVLTEPLKTELMSVYDVIATGRYPYTGHFGLLSKEDKAIVEQVMSEILIFDWKDRDFNKLSDGQKQKVLLARALAQQPEILVLDEPTSYLDIKHKVEFLSVLKRLAEKQKLTVILSLHEVELAKIVSDQIACFKDGKLDSYGKPDEVLNSEYILKLYDIDMSKLSDGFASYFNSMN